MSQGAFSFQCRHTDEAFLSQPMLRTLVGHLDAANNKDYEALKQYHTPAFTFISKTGQSTKGSDEAVEAMTANLGLLGDYFIEIIFMTGAPTGNGTHRFTSQGRVYADLPETGPEKKGCHDLQGRGWDAMAESAWVFDVVEEPGSDVPYKLSKMQEYTDMTPILSLAVKQGLIPVESLLA